MAEFDAFDTPECYPWGVAVYAAQNQNPGDPPVSGGPSACDVTEHEEYSEDRAMRGWLRDWHTGGYWPA